MIKSFISFFQVYYSDNIDSDFKLFELRDNNPKVSSSKYSTAILSPSKKHKNKKY